MFTQLKFICAYDSNVATKLVTAVVAYRWLLLQCDYVLFIKKTTIFKKPICMQKNLAEEI